MNRQLLLLILFLLLFFQPKGYAQQLGPDASVSILTCDPGMDVYSMYGHTAIRVKDESQNIDTVFNYGLFSFDAPDFMYRFAKGQTDYLMGGEKYGSFMREYIEDKRSVYEQVLNLPPDGKTGLFKALLENAKPDNRQYRYNFFMDNCATRVRDMIERNAGVTVHFTDNHPSESYRDLIKKYHHHFRWIDLGIDLLVGKKADQPVSAYGQMFLPDYLKAQFAGAKITSGETSQPLVLETHTILSFPNASLISDWPWPAIVFGCIFLIVAGISVRNIRRKKSTDWLDYWLLGLSGLSGLIIGWFTLYSEHPAMSPNYNLLWAFPSNLVFVAIWRVKKWRIYSRYYFYLVAAILLLSLFVGQQFNPVVYMIMLMLLVRCGVNLFGNLNPLNS